MEQVNSCDVDLEDGELSKSSDEVYTPLQRPASLSVNASSNAATGSLLNSENNEACSPLATCHQMQEALEEDEFRSESSDSSSGESSDSCLKKLNNDANQMQGQKRKRKRVKRTVMVRVQPTGSADSEKRARFKKYNIWTAALQEETLTENMRDCDVTLKSYNDRNVENYDYTQKYKMNGMNSIKRRRLSNSTDDFSDGELHSMVKRGRPSSRERNESHPRRSIKSCIGKKSTSRERPGSLSTSDSDNCYQPLHILDLSNPHGKAPMDIAREMSNKLYEEKEDLFKRIVEVLGTELPIEIYKQTQRIEADGGMTIKNGNRRRTPGGVFLFLLKNDDRLSQSEKELLFKEDKQQVNKWRKVMKSIARDRKVEELKKRLNEKEKEMATLKTRQEHFLLGNELSMDNQTSLSNPPPSPVGQETNFEYKPDTINHVVTDVGIKDTVANSTTSALNTTPVEITDDNLVSYDDDFLNLHPTDMDFV